MAKKDMERAPIICRKTQSGLSPVSAFEQELLDRYPVGAELEISIKQRRSLPQLKTYFKMLSYVNEATELYPTVEHMHEALKLYLGYVTEIQTIDGKIAIMADSAAFAAMDGAAFTVFMDQAKRALAEKVGFDPMGWQNKERHAA